MAEGKKKKITINKDLLRLIVKLKNAGVTDQKMAEHLTQLDEAKKIAKDTYKKVRTSSNSGPPPWAKLIPYLKADFWKYDLIFPLLAGYVYEGRYLIDLETEQRVRDPAAAALIAQERIREINTIWDGDLHKDIIYHPADTSISKRVFGIYCINFALKKGYDIRWYEWAMLENQLPQGASTKPKFNYTPKKTNHGYLPHLEKILKKAHTGGEELPDEEQVYNQLLAMNPDNLKFDEEAKTFQYKLKTKTKADKKLSRAVTLRALKQAIDKRTSKLLVTS